MIYFHCACAYMLTSVSLQGSSSPEDHATYVWQHIIQKSVAKEVYIVAHSYGGIVTVHLVYFFIDVSMYVHLTVVVSW